MGRITLWNGFSPDEDGFAPYLEIHTIDSSKPLGAVIVCPGGGYGGRAEHEGAPVAETFNALGYHAFVLHYRVAPNRHPLPLCDAAQAVRIVRNNAEKWSIKPDKIALLGFSAGGHLTASLGVHFNDVPVPAELAKVSCRPDAIVPCYAVINDHEDSFNNLFGESANDVTREYFCLNKHVSADTPPAFLWHTAKDVGVPVANALDFCSALDRNGVSFELHVFPRGDHGLGLAVNIPEAAIWPELVSAWLTQMGWK